MKKNPDLDDSGCWIGAPKNEKKPDVGILDEAGHFIGNYTDFLTDEENDESDTV